SKNTAIANLGDGFDVAGDGYVFTGNTVKNNNIDGISVSGSHETITGNTGSNNTRDGFFLGINNSTVSGNTAQRNGRDGIDLGGNDNTISGNTLHDNQRHGIDLTSSSTGNTVTGNTALGDGLTLGGFDLFDGSGTTTQNTWTHNTATTRNPAGLGSRVDRGAASRRAAHHEGVAAGAEARDQTSWFCIEVSMVKALSARRRRRAAAGPAGRGRGSRRCPECGRTWSARWPLAGRRASGSGSR